jgi:hypothetical protein
MLTRRAFLAAIGVTAAAVATAGWSEPGLDQALLVGDVVTIPGVLAVNPSTRKAIPGMSRLFVVIGIEGDRVQLCPHFIFVHVDGREILVPDETREITKSDVQRVGA